MGNMILLVLVQADAAHESDLNFVSHRNSAQELRAGAATLLSNCEQRRDVVCGMRVICCQESVVHVQFADGYAVGPCSPLRFEPLDDIDSQKTRAVCAWMR